YGHPLVPRMIKGAAVMAAPQAISQVAHTGNIDPEGLFPSAVLGGGMAAIGGRGGDESTVSTTREPFEGAGGVLASRGTNVGSSAVDITRPDPRDFAKQSGREPLLLTGGNPTTHTLDQIRALRGRARWIAAEEHIQQTYGSQGQRYFSLPKAA